LGVNLFELAYHRTVGTTQFEVTNDTPWQMWLSVGAFLGAGETMTVSAPVGGSLSIGPSDSSLGPLATIKFVYSDAAPVWGLPGSFAYFEGVDNDAKPVHLAIYPAIGDACPAFRLPMTTTIADCVSYEKCYRIAVHAELTVGSNRYIFPTDQCNEWGDSSRMEFSWLPHTPQTDPVSISGFTQTTGLEMYGGGTPEKWNVRTNIGGDFWLHAVAAPSWAN
jgi:hypothetical protein